MLLSRLHVLITGDNTSAKRSLQEVDRALVKTAARARAGAMTTYRSVDSVGRSAAKYATTVALATAVTSSFTTALLGLSGGAIVGAVAGIGAAALGIVSGFAVAGIAVGAFAAIAAPTIIKVKDAYTEYTKALDAQAAAEKLTDPAERAKALEKAYEDQEAALAQLSGGQTQVVQNLVQLRKEWQNTAKQMEPTTLNLLNEGIRTLRAGLPLLLPVAAATGTALGGLATQMREAMTGVRMQDFLKIVEAEAPALVTQIGQMGFNLAGGFANGFTVGLPLVKEAFGGLVDFTQAIEDGLASEGFKNFIDFGVEMLPLLGGLVKQFGSTLVSLFSGLEPIAGAVITTLTGLFKSLEGVFRSPAMDDFANRVATLMPEVGDTLRAVGGVAGALGKAVAPLVPVLLDSLQLLGANLKAILGGPNATEFIQNLSGALPDVVDLLSAAADGLLDIAAAVVSTIAPLIPELVGPLKAISGVVADVLAAFGPVVLGIAGPLSDFAEAVGQVVIATGPLIRDVVQGLLPVLSALSATLVESIPAWQDLSQEVVGIFPELADAGAAFISMLPTLISVAATIVQTLMPAVTTLLKGFAEVFSFFAEHETTTKVLAFAILGLAGSIIAVRQAIAGYQAVKALVDNTRNAWTMGRAVVLNSRLMIEHIGQMSSVWRARMVQMGRDALAAAANTARSFGSMVASAGRWVATMVATAARTAASWAVMAGTAVANAAIVVAGWASMAVAAVANAAIVVGGWVLMGTQALIQAARMAAAWVIAMGPVGWAIAAIVGIGVVIYRNWDAIVGATKRAWEWVSNFVVGVGRRVLDFFMRWSIIGIVVRHWDGITDAFSRGASAVINFVRDLPGRLWEQVSGWGSTLRDAGANLIRGLVDGIKSMASAPFDAVRDVLGRVRDLFPFSPAKTGPFAGQGWTGYSGRALLGDFETGIKRELPSVRSTLAAGLGGLSAEFSPTVSHTATLPVLPSVGGSTVTIQGGVTVQGGGTAEENVKAFSAFVSDLSRGGRQTIRQQRGRG